jgi:hypothetical protein
MKRIVDEARSRYGPVEVKRVGNNYYISRVSSVYDPVKRRARKISGEYIGKITPSGIVRAERRSSAPRSVFEYGNAKFLYDLSSGMMEGLKTHFPSMWREMFAMCTVRTKRHTPMKYMDAAWEKLYLSVDLNASLSPSTLSSTLRYIGKDWESQRRFFMGLMKKGYNRHRINIRQIDFAIASSRNDFIPTVLKAASGFSQGREASQSFPEGI